MALDDKPDVPEELKTLSKDMKNVLATFSEVKDSNKETKANLEKVLGKFEDLNGRYAKDYAEWQKGQADLKEALAAAEKKASEAVAGSKDAAEAKKRVEDLELKLATASKRASEEGDDSPSWSHKSSDISRKRSHPERQSAHYKACFDYLCKGIAPAGASIAVFRPDIDLKTLRTDSDVQGGYLIPQVMDNEIRKNITEISPVRLFARVRQAPSKTMDVPRRLSLLAAYYEGEGETSPTDQSTYGQEQVTLYRQTVTVPATLDMMISSAFDLEREIASDVGESFGKNEGTNFVTGNNQKKPQGFITDTRCEVVTTATSAEVDFVDIANLIGKLKRGQSPWLFMNRRTLAKMWSIKSTIGVPIWQPVAGSTPATIWGFPYNSDFIDLDDAQNGSNAKPIVFGDLRRGYEIFDMIGISVIRDDLTRKKEAITEWTFRRYNTGRVIMPEAIKILKIQ